VGGGITIAEGLLLLLDEEEDDEDDEEVTKMGGMRVCVIVGAASVAVMAGDV
jgi:hypothetical protein